MNQETNKLHGFSCVQKNQKNQMCSLALDCATYNQKTPGGVHDGVQNSSSLALTMEIQ